MGNNTVKTETGMPREMKKLLIDLDITFLDWCSKYGFTRETARNVAAGIITGNKGKSGEIMNALKSDFPEIFCSEKTGTELQQKKRHNRITKLVMG